MLTRTMCLNVGVISLILFLQTSSISGGMILYSVYATNHIKRWLAYVINKVQYLLNWTDMGNQLASILYKLFY